MTSKQVGQKALKWSFIAERVNARQQETFSAFRTKTTAWANKVNLKPGDLPKIDFSHYKRTIADKAVVAKFEKMYAALSIPYPQDKLGLMSTVQDEEKTAMDQKGTYIATQQQNMATQTDMMKRMDILLPPLNEMSMQMYYYYFPDTCWDPRSETQCRIYRQDQDYCQPDYTKEPYARRRSDKQGFTTVAAYENYWQNVYDKQQTEKAAKALKAGK